MLQHELTYGFFLCICDFAKDLKVRFTNLLNDLFPSFSGEARDILLRNNDKLTFTEILQEKPYFWLFLQYQKYFTKILTEKPLFLVISSELEIFYQESDRKALLLVIPTELEIFYQESDGKALLLVIPTELEIFYQESDRKALFLESPTFGHTYRTRNILPRK